MAKLLLKYVHSVWHEYRQRSLDLQDFLSSHHTWIIHVQVWQGTIALPQHMKVWLAEDPSGTTHTRSAAGWNICATWCLCYMNDFRATEHQRIGSGHGSAFSGWVQDHGLNSANQVILACCCRESRRYLLTENDREIYLSTLRRIADHRSDIG